MPVSGLVLTLNDDSDLRVAATESLRRHPSIEPGELHGHRLPVVVDTRSSDEDRQVWEWLHQLPGVHFVDLVCADASQDADSDETKTHVAPTTAADADRAGRGRS